MMHFTNNFVENKIVSLKKNIYRKQNQKQETYAGNLQIQNGSFFQKMKIIQFNIEMKEQILLRIFLIFKLRKDQAKNTWE